VCRAGSRALDDRHKVVDRRRPVRGHEPRASGARCRRVHAWTESARLTRPGRNRRARRRARTRTPWVRSNRGSRTSPARVGVTSAAVCRSPMKQPAIQRYSDNEPPLPPSRPGASYRPPSARALPATVSHHHLAVTGGTPHRGATRWPLWRRRAPVPRRSFIAGRSPRAG
jgi:hypothetical protein